MGHGPEEIHDSRVYPPRFRQLEALYEDVRRKFHLIDAKNKLFFYFAPPYCLSQNRVKKRPWVAVSLVICNSRNLTHFFLSFLSALCMLLVFSVPFWPHA